MKDYTVFRRRRGMPDEMVDIVSARTKQEAINWIAENYDIPTRELVAFER